MRHLTDLRELTAVISKTTSPLDAIRTLLTAVVDLAKGREAVLCITSSEIKAVISDEDSQETEIDLDGRIRLASTYAPADQVDVPGEDNDPVLLEDGSLLVVPLPSGKIAVAEPKIEATSYREQKVVFKILADLAAGELNNAVEMADVRKNLRTLNHVNKQLQKTNMSLRERTMIDELTGLYNRRFFERSLSYEIERFLRYRHPISVVLFDIDYFKKINDNYGHNMGDGALRHTATIAKDSIRGADIIARYGGDEFVILQPDTQLEDSIITAERLRARVEDAPLAINGDRLHLTVSAGVTAVGDNIHARTEGVIQTADQALYQAKDEGRNRVVVI
ncbi:MAG: GGDEF domain-containing protein [Proteobacteria bacterium]|nr:GGDEF domain-containing protein [Pseudomonadota bacterium]